MNLEMAHLMDRFWNRDEGVIWDLIEQLNECWSEAEMELRHRQEQIVEARRIADELAPWVSESEKILSGYQARSWA